MAFLRLQTLRLRWLSALLMACVWSEPSVASVEQARAAFARGDLVAVFEALEPAAEAGDAEAQFELALMHLNGMAVAKDARVAATWLRQASELGHTEAQFLFGSMIYRGEGVPQDHREALHWFRRAAMAGHAEAQLNLGLMHERGDGTRQDDVRAHMWLNLAAARFSEAQSRERKLAVRGRDRVAQRLTPVQLETAHRLASDWLGRSAARSFSSHP